MSSVAALVQKLSEIQDRLVALPDDAFDERGELIRRRNELRREAAAHAAGADHARPAEDLLAELATQRIRRSEMGTAGSGATPDVVLKIEGRIARIEAILEQRSIPRR